MPGSPEAIPPEGGRGLSRAAAAAVVAVSVAAPALLGRRNAPGPAHPAIDRWYRGLRKPAFTPPDPVFGAVWPAVETALAYGGYRLLRKPPGAARNASLGLWLLNTGMIAGWTELFFRRRRLGAGAGAAAAMLAGGVGYVAAAAEVDKKAAAAGVPLVAWLGFATLLAEEVWRRNPPRGGRPG
jgi:translocator protein